MGHTPIGSASAILSDEDQQTTQDRADAAAAWLGEKIAGFFSDSEDMSDYTGGDALHTSIEEKALTLEANQEQIISSLENTAEYADNAAIPTGMEAVVLAFDAEEDQETAQADMEAAIDEYYAGVQEDVLTAWDNQFTQIFDWADDINANDDLDDLDVVETYSGESPTWRDGHTLAEKWPDGGRLDSNSSTYTLYDGSEMTVNAYKFTDNGNTSEKKYIASLHPDDYNGPSYGRIRIKSFDGDGTTQVIDQERYHDLWQAIDDSYDRVYGELSGFVADLYEAYEPGEIDTAEIVDPLTAHTQFRNEIDDASFRGAHAAGSLGIPRTTGSEPMQIYLVEDDITVEGSIYGAISDDHAPLQVEQRYYTEVSQLDDGDTEEDADGNTVPIDESATPVLDENPLWIRATLREENADGEETVETDYGDLEQPFTIVEAVDQDGNDVSEVPLESGPQYDPSDIESIEEQLEQIREYQREQQEEAQDNLGSGGLFGGAFAENAEGFLSDTIYGVPIIGWLVAVSGIGIYLNGD